MAIWSLVNKGGNFIELGERFSIPPILARIIRNRGVVGEEAMQKYEGGSVCPRITEKHDKSNLSDEAVYRAGEKNQNHWGL